jgi:hypothetical protein
MILLTNFTSVCLLNWAPFNATRAKNSFDELIDSSSSNLVSITSFDVYYQVYFNKYPLEPTRVKTYNLNIFF